MQTRHTGSMVVNGGDVISERMMATSPAPAYPNARRTRTLVSELK